MSTTPKQAAAAQDSAKMADTKSKYEILMQEFSVHHKIMGSENRHPFFCKQLQKFVTNLLEAYDID